MNQGTRWVLLMQKNRRRKSHAWAPLRHCIVIPVQSFGSHIRTQPSGLGLNHDSCRTDKYEFQMSTVAESRNPE